MAEGFAGFLQQQCAECCGCSLIEDDFERPDLGDLWEAGEGASASIVAGEMVTSDADARIINIVEFPEGPDSLGDTRVGAARVKVRADSAGAEALVIGWYKDADNYVYCLYRFSASDPELEMWERVAGTDTQIFPTQDADVSWLIEGRGMADTVIRMCWTAQIVAGRRFRVTLHDPDTDEIVFRGQSAVPSGSYVDQPGATLHGVGTGDVPSGSVYFDDYRAEYDPQQPRTTNNPLVECETCFVCPFCPDDQVLCVAITGCDSVAGGQFNGTHITTRNVSSVGDHNCSWTRNFELYGYDFEGNPVTATVHVRVFTRTVEISTTSSEVHYFLSITLSTGGFQAAYSEVDLGKDPPDGATFDHLEVPTGGCPDEYGADTWTVTSGSECYEYGGPCPDLADMPEELTLDLTGGSYTGTYTLSWAGPGTFNHVGSLGTGITAALTCVHGNWLFTLDDTSVSGTRVASFFVDLQSDDPWHWLGSGDGFDVEITE
jgi:hypothetical protein